MMPMVFILESIHAAGVERLRKFARVEYLLNRPRAEILSRLPEADAVVCKSVTCVDGEFIDAAPRLKVVGRAGTGTDNFDRLRLAEKGIPLITVPTGNSVSAAEFTVMCILMLAKNAAIALDAVRKGDFRRDQLEGRELLCMTVGLLGFGNVGQLTAERLLTFGCRVVAHDLHPEKIAHAMRMGVTPVDSPAALMAASDIVSLHASLNEGSKGIINRRILSGAKPGLWLVNTARGGLMVDADVLDALDRGLLAGLAIDTLVPDPPYNAIPGEHSYSHCFLGHPKVVVFPHMAASTSDAQERIALTLVEGMRKALESSRGRS